MILVKATKLHKLVITHESLRNYSKNNDNKLDVLIKHITRKVMLRSLGEYRNGGNTV